MKIQKSDNPQFYNNGQTSDDYYRKNRRPKPPDMIDRRVIAWDMEGISLSGQNKPQHAVLFGCSAEVDTPLKGEKLGSYEMLSYMIDIAERYPHALHVGYAYKYDANMTIAGLPDHLIVKLWKFGVCNFRLGDQYWTIKWTPGKMFTVSRRFGKKKNTRRKASLTIYDYSSFFGKAFLQTCEDILRDELTDEDREVIEHGKAARGHNSWDDMPEIEHYWKKEIVLIQRVFEKFRDVMYRAGFNLKEWYGPGALANYINATRGIRPHLAGVQTTSGYMPAEVHRATKIAFSGGRFELFRAGRIQGPIYAIDINSAYPYALTKIPSLSPEAGEWKHVDRPKKIERFGFYRIQFAAPGGSPVEYRPMPLFFRNNKGLISFPNKVHGWYASPEAALAIRLPGVRVLEGWYWDSPEDEFPWEFLQEMYDRRMRLGKKNLMSMPFKLGPNSLYGKYAQTVGWNQKKMLPPKSHALAVAGWTTSYCRSMLYSVMMQVPDKLVAVETDSIMTTADPRELDISIGDQLGQWDFTVYDEMIYMQSGMYHYKKDGEWQGVRSRGINKAEFPVEAAQDYLEGLQAGEDWGSLRIETKPRFIGAGAAIASQAPLKVVHTTWQPQVKEMTLGDTGKRIHNKNVCPKCRDGISPNEDAHPLFISSISDGEMMSFPRKLPWEGGQQYEGIAEIQRRERIENDNITGK